MIYRNTSATNYSNSNFTSLDISESVHNYSLRGVQIIDNTVNSIYLREKVYWIMLFPPQLFNFFVLLDVKSWVSEKMLIEAQTKDRYGRTVGVVFLDNQNVNNELVRQSMAWVYKKYIDNETLYELEAQAKT